MGVDYYNILKVNRNATDDSLKKSYRRLAMQWHPDKNPSDKSTAEAKFKQLTEAYEVLSDPQKRAIYDQYGEEGLKGMPPPDSTGSSDHGFNPRNAEDVFAEFFASTSKPYGFENMGRGSGAGGGTSQPRKPPPVETKLPCSLEELYTGSTRKMKISRNVLRPNGRLASESEILTIDVKPGWKKGTKVTFPDKGNEALGQLPADLAFVIDEKPHDVYTREGNDLFVRKKTPLVDALAGTTINLKTLDSRDLVIKVNEVINPGYELVIANEGMPIVKEKGKKGNLRIKFDVTFPSRLTSEQRATIRRALGG